MVVLRAEMCPGLDEDLVKDLRAADIKTGVCVCVVLSYFLLRVTSAETIMVSLPPQWRTWSHLTLRKLLRDVLCHTRYLL